MAKRASNEDKAEMMRLRNKGMTYREVGTAVGFSMTTVMRVCNPEQRDRWAAAERTPEAKVLKRAYYKTPKGMAVQKACRNKPESKALAKARIQIPGIKAAIKARAKIYSKTPEVVAKLRARVKTPEYKEQARNRRRKKYATDIQFNLGVNLRSRLYSAIKGKVKAGSAVSDLGCTIAELIIHLEKQFLPGMSWENHSHDGWHIDHIRPLASFDLTDRAQFLDACNYTNLQPLWAADNFNKSDSY